jgi:capsular polysaccharide transport system ATP-binding protein
MIVLRSAHRSVKKGKVSLPLLQDVSFTFDLPRIGLVAAHREVSEGLLDLMAGYISLERGILRRVGRVSWPLGRILPFRSYLTGRVTLRFFCDIYGLDFRKAERFVREIVNFKDQQFDRPVLEWPSLLIVEFSYAAYLVPDFEIYLAEGSISAGDEFMARWQPLFAKRTEGKQLILTAEYAHRLSPYVEKVVVAEGGKLSLYDTVDGAFSALAEAGAVPGETPRVAPREHALDDPLI